MEGPRNDKPIGFVMLLFYIVFFRLHYYFSLRGIVKRKTRIRGIRRISTD